MNGLTLLDGGFGTMIQAAGLPAGTDPTEWNVDNPAAVRAVHRAYVEAGSEIILANTFGANRLKYGGRRDLGELVRAALGNAHAAAAEAGVADKVRVALDIGPTGRLLEPAGDLPFDAAYEAFAELIRNATTASLAFIETMGDLAELKAAVLAVKENSDLPVFATVTLDESGRLLTGASVDCVAALLESLHVEAYGFNCGLGPDRMRPHVERLARLSTRPVIVKPNAGLPRLDAGRTVFDVGPEAFARDVGELVAAGASIVGGCCGTTPAHIRALTSALRRLPSSAAAHGRRDARSRVETVVSSGTSVVTLHSGEGLIIGERINPTGKKLLKEAYRSGDTAYVLREAVRQVDAGAALLDVNCGLPGLDEAALLDATVRNVQGVVTCPLQIDTSDPRALHSALRHVVGKPLVNSVTGARASMEAVFPLVRRFGGALVALCLDEAGIPPTADGRLAVARRILAEGARHGFVPADFVFDALTLSVSTDAQAAVVTLETVRRLTEELGVNTVLGVSNVSFGLPNRPALNNAMYALARKAGLSAAIANPSAIRDEADPAAVDVLLGRDANCARWIASQATPPADAAPASVPRESGADALRAAVAHGLGDDAREAARTALAAGASVPTLVDGSLVPALEEVGRGFEAGRVFLPQLLMSADAAGEAFAVIRAALARDRADEAGPTRPPVVLATVRGDVHDIGKNIVRALLENYGFTVVDLGRDVPPERIVGTARKTGAMLVGLSALMTTTVGAMAETIRLLRRADLAVPVCVGGAVVTQEFADLIGADCYAKTAMATVRFAQAVASGT